VALRPISMSRWQLPALEGKVAEETGAWE
jgi:hypothetical protein